MLLASYLSYNNIPEVLKQFYRILLRHLFIIFFSPKLWALGPILYKVVLFVWSFPITNFFYGMEAN